MNQEKEADKEFVDHTNNLHQRDLQERYNKKKSLQIHLANFYQK